MFAATKSCKHPERVGDRLSLRSRSSQTRPAPTKSCRHPERAGDRLSLRSRSSQTRPAATKSCKHPERAGDRLSRPGLVQETARAQGCTEADREVVQGRGDVAQMPIRWGPVPVQGLVRIKVFIDVGDCLSPSVCVPEHQGVRVQP